MRLLFALSFILLIITGCKDDISINRDYFTPGLDIDTFIVNINQETYISTKNNAYIKIPAFSFSYPNGDTVFGEVNLYIQEAFNIKEIYNAGLTTRSDDEIIESAGMINILANKDSFAINIAPNKSIEVLIPKNVNDKEWLAFKGTYSNEINSVNWMVSNDSINTVLLDTIISLISSGDTVLDNTRIEYENYIHRICKTTHTDTIKLDSFYSGSASGFPLLLIESNANSSSFLLKDSDGRLEQLSQEMDFTTPNVVSDSLASFVDTPSKLDNYFSLTIFDLGWKNIDKFLSLEESSELYVVSMIDNQRVYTNINISLLFLERNIALNSFRNSKGWYLFNPKYKAKVILPRNEPVLFIMSGNISDTLYYDIQKLILKDNNIIKFKPKKITKNKLEEIIDNEL